MLTPIEMQSIEERAFSRGACPEALMEEAGTQMAATVQQFCPKPGICLAVFGKGHNGGDALVAGRLLSEQGWKVVLVPAYPRQQWAPLTAKKWDQAGRCEMLMLEDMKGWRPPPATPCAVLDGLLGIGSRGPLKAPVLDACRFINHLRASTGVRVFALDLPTGLDGFGGVPDTDAVVADATFCVGFVKAALLADTATGHVGRLAVLPLSALTEAAEGMPPLECATPAALRPLWARRANDMHKGEAGRVTLIAGSQGTVGAGILAAKGALRAGAGLVTLCVPENVYSTAAALAPAECMVRPIRSFSDVFSIRTDALGIGPGVGLERAQETLSVVERFPGPAVVDADALTILGGARLHPLERARGPRLLTPHPGEMERMYPKGELASRRMWVEAFIQRWPATLLLKGARTLVGTRGRGICANTTGNPGMASGGMGDVLTGVCTALLARGVSCHEAGVLGAWLCGRAAEERVASGAQSEESLLAGDVADGLGAAFSALRQSGF